MRVGIIWVMLAVSAVSAFFINGCGGSSGGGTSPQVVSGTASSGAPWASKTVSLKDYRNKSLSVTSSAAGVYSFDVTGLTAPFIINAGTLYSVATATGTTNVNPFTNVVARSAAGTVGIDAIFSNMSTNRANLNSLKTALPTAKSNFDSKLTAIYTKYNMTTPPDFLNGAITIDQGVDYLFKDIKVNVSGTNVTITDAAGTATLVNGSFSGTTFNFTVNTGNINSLPGVVTVTPATSCKTGFVGSTSTFTIPGVTCSSMTFCVGVSNPGTGYYLVKGQEIPLDNAKIMAQDVAYITGLATQLSNACK